MLKSRYLACTAVAGLAVCGAQPLHAQSFPNKPIRVITSPAGGGNDFVARLLVRSLSESLGQQVIVDNRATRLIADIVAKAPPDGYTLLISGSAHWIGPLLEKFNYDAIKDFEPITLLDRAPTVLVVHPSMPLKSVKQLIALAKSRPTELNFSVGGAGSSNFVGSILFNHMAGVKIELISYKGASPAMTAVMSGEVHAMFASAGGVAPHIEGRRLRALGVGSLKPSVLAPGMPTLDAAGLPGFVAESLHALYAPAGTPSAVVARLLQETTRHLQSAETKKILLKAGIESAPGTPQELTAAMTSEIDRISTVLKAANLGVK